MTKQVVLMYHDVYAGDTSESGFQNVGAMPYKISKENFAKQVSRISKFCDSRGVDKSRVVFTFDDGGRSFLYVIADVLESYGFVGLFFVATAYISSPGFLTEEDVVALRDRGHKIGSHSHTHPERMDTLSPEKLHDEWSESISILSNLLGEPVSTASVPNGFVSHDVYQVMIDSGIDTIYNSTPTTKEHTQGGIKIYGRYAITNDMSLEKVLGIVSNKGVRHRIQLRYGVLALAKKLLGNSYLKLRNVLLRK